MAWIELVLAMALFLASHRIPAALGVKRHLIGVLGPRGYGILFSLLSILLLWWLISAAGRAPFIGLWDQQIWHRCAVNILMPFAIALAVCGIAAPNPFAFEGRRTGFDPARPGIAGITRQPLLWSLALWSGVHLLPNGDLAHVLLFGPFLIMALVGMPMVERRRRHEIGQAEWQRLAARTGLIPFAALLQGRWRPQGLPSWPRLVLFAILWPAVWHLHEPIIGVWPGV